MRVLRHGLLSDIGQSFGDVARAPLPTYAVPTAYAPPVDIRADEDLLTVTFAVGADRTPRVRVDDVRLIIEDVRDGEADASVPSAMRLFVLPRSGGLVATERVGPLVHVRLDLSASAREVACAEGEP